ncbi:bacillithiol biosynthesis cysteine-adding enzyme BshC [Virgibacillus sp. CM-4]|uniref:bacillithiol biosynthesis cysteine-adding enzyme BshC n=1 Tax=Virgibacillus sp. CM-4 TaxID=1354277 RepID=UPI001E2E2C82|nr:bacillithiol biosynthesis cysteine-adding enzyme BshC [Virgibacillus sp. CM-4]
MGSMQVDPIVLEKQNKLVKDYRDNAGQITAFFDYPIPNKFYQRYQDLKERCFKREALSQVLRTINKQWGAPSSTYHNIDRLEREDSVVVIGGQQAGLLTGPMYTINKVISIIQLAKEQEEKLQVPVIPVFWIAGEDHDFEEVNHVFLPHEQQMKKFKLHDQNWEKRSLSEKAIDHNKMEEWLDSLFVQLSETDHTKGLHERIKQCLSQSNTYVDFFATLIYQLFPDHGLVLIDSGNHLVRKLESEYFIQLIENQLKISEGVCNALMDLDQYGYSVSLEVEKSDAHLFFHKDNERILLRRTADGQWQGKQNEVLLSTEEIISVAKENPESLSNNVVTRPVMQELVFPTLAFIGGPGEISYWSALKPAFHALEINMPPVLPRLSFTIIERQVEKLLKEYHISAHYAINYGTMDEKKQWFEEKNQPAVDKVAQQVKKAVEEAHVPLKELAKGMGNDLGDLADKNLYYLKDTINFLEDRLIKALEEEHSEELAAFNSLHCTLQPEDGLQERIWNPLPWLNRYGLEIIKEITDHSFPLENEHYAIYL